MCRSSRVARLHIQILPFTMTFDLLLTVQRPPDFDGVVVADGDENLGILRVERNTVDNIVVLELSQMNAVMSVPQITVLILCTAET